MRTRTSRRPLRSAPSLFLLASTTFAVATFTRGAAAQGAEADRPAPPSAAAPGATPPASPPLAPASTADVVKLKDGSLFRGLILENVVGDHVAMKTATGDVRSFPAADVVYAGPASAQPAPPPVATPEGAPPPAPAPMGPPQALVTLDAPAIKLHFEATAPDTDFHLRTGDSVISGVAATSRGAAAFSGSAQNYAHICTAPCDATLPKGTHRLALSQGQEPVETDHPVVIDGAATLRGTYESHQGQRIAGWVLFGTAIPLGTLAIILGVTHEGEDCSNQFSDGYCPTKSEPDGALMAGGAVLLIAGGITGLVLGLHRDTSTIEVVPFGAPVPTSPVARATRVGGWLAPGRGAPGLALRARF